MKMNNYQIMDLHFWTALILKKLPCLRNYRFIYQIYSLFFKMGYFKGYSVKKSSGFFTQDEILAFKMLQNKSMYHPSFQFLCRYTTNNKGWRTTYNNSNNEIICLGGSYTFGTGVDNDETFPSILSKKDLKVSNCATMAWGTGHQFLLLKNSLINLTGVKIILYGWHPLHLDRNYKNGKWLKSLAKSGRKNPCFEIRNKKLVYIGLIDPNDGISEDDPSLFLMQWRISFELIKECVKICDQKNIKFIPVLLPVNSSNDKWLKDVEKMNDFLKHENIPFFNLNLKGEKLYKENGFYYFYDAHPTKKWHQMVAARILAKLKEGKFI